MHVGGEALLQFMAEQFARDECVRLVCGFQPGPRQALMTAVAEQGLVISLGIFRRASARVSAPLMEPWTCSR
jgi:hypothetical protein